LLIYFDLILVLLVVVEVVEKCTVDIYKRKVDYD